jgi:arabinose-5-phosphate isomerase
MASTTAMLALGDAIAEAVARKNGFTRDDYAALHPGGALGYRLLSRVADLMHEGDDVPRLRDNVSLRQAILAMTAKRLGTVFFVDDADGVVGVITDGDIRRTLQHEPHPLEHPVRDVMTASPRATTPDTSAIDALRLMEEQSPVTCLAVVDANGRLVGALHIHDLIRAGIA